MALQRRYVASYAQTIRGICSLECAVKLLIIVLTKYNYTVDLNVTSGISIYHYTNLTFVRP